MVIGGEKIYALWLPYATQLYITQIEKVFDGDAKFPKIDLSKWQEIEKEIMPANEVHAFDYHYLHYKKINISRGDYVFYYGCRFLDTSS